VLPLLKKSKRARIVNLTSGNGSFGFFNNPNVPLPDRNTLLAYASSKAALNMMTVRLAHQLKDLGVKVNAADPGFTATDMDHHRGARTAEDAAATPVRLALLADDGATGGVFANDGPESW
jgi:NAD(P)-dependent dehydrogenase (short-subunit alcohol dehydrogenase family)